MEACDRKVAAKGWCSKHYYRLREKYCTVDGCERRYRANGFCNTHRRKVEDPNRKCVICSETFIGSKRSNFCSASCKTRGRRSPMINALADGIPDVIRRTAREMSDVTEGGCWKWKYAKNSAGYGIIGQSGKAGLVHRRVFAALVQHPGSQPIHHRCATPSCVNPEHLQLVSHRENVAEMMERTFYQRRILELENALRKVDPGHPLLKEASVPKDVDLVEST